MLLIRYIYFLTVLKENIKPTIEIFLKLEPYYKYFQIITGFTVAKLKLN